jgi:hypothetical protein
MNFVVLVLAFLVFVPWALSQERILSVCDLIIHREEYNGRIVTVRGPTQGSEEGSWLAAGDECTYALVTKGVAWPIAITLAFPNNKSKDPLDHADFAVDWTLEKGEAAAVRRMIQKGKFDPRSDHLEFTFVGLFRTYPDLEERVSPNIQNSARGGFGHMGAFPAKLLIKTRREPVVVHGDPIEKRK